MKDQFPFGAFLVPKVPLAKLLSFIPILLSTLDIGEPELVLKSPAIIS